MGGGGRQVAVALAAGSSRADDEVDKPRPAHSPRLRSFLHAGQHVVSDWILAQSLGRGACGVVYAASPREAVTASHLSAMAVKQVDCPQVKIVS